MSSAPPASWTLACPWCDHRLTVFARGQRGGDQGSGYEAAERMRAHVERMHGRTWADFLGGAPPRT